MTEDNTHVKIGLRTRKTKSNSLGWVEIDMIPADEVCILALPGSNANTSKKANGFAKMVQSLLKDKHFPIYSTEYDLAERNFRIDREAILSYYQQENKKLPYHRFVKEEDKTYIPQYIKDIYSQTIAPRLRNNDGTPAPIDLSSQRLNKLIFVNHCHGSSVMMQLERLMEKDLKKLGYDSNTRDNLLKQVISVNIAPVSPYGVTKTSCFKFLSLSDNRVTSVSTPELNYINNRKAEHERFLSLLNKNTTSSYEKPFVMNFSMFRPTENETVFAVNNMYPVEIQKQEEFDGIEHTFDSYSDIDDDDRTKQGDQLSIMLRYTINWLTNHAKQNQEKFVPLPDITKVPALKTLVDRACNNRYNLKTRELKLLKENMYRRISYR